MKYCIFGGSFDPPHAGHKYLAKSALDTLRLDKLIWLPATDPPHKAKPSTPFRHRLAMVELAISDDSRQAVSAVEDSLPKPSYSMRAIEALQKEYGPGNDWYLLIGGDNWAIFPTWHRWQDILKAVTVVVFPRGGRKLDTLPPGVLRLDLPEMDREANLIRKALASGAAPDGAGLLPEIRDYVRTHGLYATAQPGTARP